MIGVLDAHVHIGRSAYGENLDVDSLLSSMDEHGIDTAVVTAFTPPWLDFDAANRQVAEAVRMHPRRLIGAARVDPRMAGACDSLRAAHADGLRGLALHPAEQGVPVNHPIMFDVVAVAQELGLFVHVPVGLPVVSTPFQVAALAKSFPSVPFVMGNMGLNQYFGDVLATLPHVDNLFVDTAGHVLSGDLMNGIRAIVDATGPERVLFASDAPYFDQRIERMKIGLARLSAAHEQLVLGGNMARILGLA
jgi:uncharacterized protein